MSDILCRWLNSELRLSKSIEPRSVSRDFANGYLIGEVLHKYQLQEDFDQFLKSSTATSKLNNFTRVEPTLQLLGVPFDLTVARAVMQERRGAATQLLYQLYILLQKKKKSGVTGTAMETMRPAATGVLHRVEAAIYSERLKTVVKREADLKLQKIALQYEQQGLEMYDRSLASQLVDEQKRQAIQEEIRLQDIEKHRLARRRQMEIMSRIQTAVVQIPRPPPSLSLKAQEKRQKQRRRQEAQKVQVEIAQFEKNRKKLSPARGATSSLSPQQQFLLSREGAGGGQQSQAGRPSVGLAAQATSQYIQEIRRRLEEDASARQQRERRRSKVLVEQLSAHEAQEEALREEQLVERLTRQSQQERRLAVQLMQLRSQKEVLRQNRVFREQQHQEQRERDFQEALEREAALARQAVLDYAEENRREIELHDRMAAQRAESRYRKHFVICQEVLQQVVDLATKVGEYRLLTGNLIPAKLMSEWKELLFCGKPLYPATQDLNTSDPLLTSDPPLTSDPSPQLLLEMEKIHILNQQDYDEYTTMTGEWAWPEVAGEPKAPPPNNNILGHVVMRLTSMVCPPAPPAPPPSCGPRHPLRACVLGKLFSGKTTCLKHIAQVHDVHILSANNLVQEALMAYRTGEMQTGSELSALAQQGGAVERVLRKGKAVPDELLIDIVAHAIKGVPADVGWVLDGVPVSVAQARLLEAALGGAALGGADSLDKDKKKKKPPSLALEPNAPKDPPPPTPVLDLVLLLDVSDDQILKRAARQACEEESRDRLGGDAPKDPAESPRQAQAEPQAQARAQPLTIRDKSLEKKQIQHRITSFQDTWPKLEKWFSGKQSILVRIDAELEERELFRRVEAVLFKRPTQPENVEDVGLDGEKTSDASSTQLHLRPQEGTPNSSSTQLHPQPQEDPLDGSSTQLQLHPQPQEGATESSESTVAVKKSTSRSPKGGARKLSVTSSCGGKASPSEPPSSADWVYVDEPLPEETPHFLVPHWENVCEAYVSNIKTVMQNLRRERIVIIHHLFNIREEYKQFLCRPDLKQEFVSQWQQDFNSLPDDMRPDEETKAELHQRLDDLLERLWDICDRRREEAGQERAVVMGDGWLDDHTGILINHYSTLMQVEVDRFQDSVFLLRDYYAGMYQDVLPDTGPDFTCLPLLDLAELEESDSAERGSKSAGSKKEHEGEEKKKTQVVPLISRRPLSTESSSRQRNAHDPEDKTLQHIYSTALAAINNIVCVEAQQREVEEGEEVQRQQERERLQRPSQASALPPDGDKDKKKTGKKKGPPSPVEEPSPPPAPLLKGESEVMLRLALRARIRQEYAAALQHEEAAVKVRVDLIRACALVVLRSLQKGAEQAFKAMQDWLGARFLSEMTSIDQLAEVVRHQIEAGSPLPNELVLEKTDFWVDGDLRVVASPPPPPQPAPLEEPLDGSLSLRQLHALLHQLQQVAPSGVVSGEQFSEVLQDLTCLDLGGDALPEPWMLLSQPQLAELVSMVTQNSAMLDWRQFLLSSALPWPRPSLAQLLDTLQRFKMADAQGTGYVMEERYLQTDLWFPAVRSLPAPEDQSEPLPYNRLAHLHKFFFRLFSDGSSTPPRLDYVRMLLYMSAHPDPPQGFTRALSVVLGRALPHPSFSRLLKSVPCLEEGVSEAVEEEEEEEGEVGVSVGALLRVVCHGAGRAARYSRFQPRLLSPEEEHREELVRVFRDLGLQPDAEAPFSLLSQHPLLQDLMESATQHQLIDIPRLLQGGQ
ncbi:sperm flagellar protein 2 [Osmerus eperlanus]|uniref:sperm flagellar protein 2 n=1 Tax=Osmerus eperlanus TaxID=29151 RepID=UPI002E15EBD4